MKKEDRLIEIQELWERRNRIEPWENLNWEADVREDKNIDAKTVNEAEMKLKYHGHVIDILDGSEIEVAETDWDDYLLHYLRVWYYLSESCNAPLFVHEEACAVAIAEFDPERFDLLFYHPGVHALGMKNWEKEMRKWNAEIHERKKASRRKHPDLSTAEGQTTPIPVSITEATKQAHEPQQ